ncbi:type IV pilus assembly protein PilB [Alkalibacterium putridalgicola]|uniref:Type II secretion system protein E n=1 Tax=Alkalibacterium putridalgicola TaxID=426703 RepID=A0A1H7T756_9LACT|nr:GspE/PulE family protein [Alkalibacterium putridalgicola]GEK89326.1 type II secretion system protein E [Alkalibacterium putridalgicola]SEL80700.1 type IV pilus assembly protein PilB [Alkalibacterium putridalgicola]
MPERKRKKLGDFLKDAGLVTETQIVEALEQKKNNQKLGVALVDQGYITEKQLLNVLEIQLKLESVSLYQYPIDETLIDLISKDFARSNLLMPIKRENNRLVVAMHDPLDFYAIEELELSTGYNLQPMIATKDDILQTINRLYDAEEVNIEDVEGEDAPAVRIFDQLLETGVAMHASDIHLDSKENTVSVRYRVDGVLRSDRTLPKSLMNSLVARIKIMAGLNITESRLPQDGRISTTVIDKKVNLRVSTLPTVFGEKVVIRILDMSNVFNKVSDIGLQEDTLQDYEELIKQPSGLILLTGPTGSGKSSTLYGSINELNSPESNIITVEDPVEYQLDGINQVQVNAPIGLTFAKGLRSILRQDPNIIMVGEIRDTETAEISIRASLTGHLVFSTLHTNSAIEAIPRLFDMGVEPYLVVSSLSGVMAQRLVKTVCKDCAQTRQASPIEKEVFEKRNMSIDEVTSGAGCDACRHTGYRGRMAIHELIVITDEVKELMMNNASMQEIKKHIKAKGVRFLIDDGLEKVKQGKTTIDEVLRVASLDE